MRFIAILFLITLVGSCTKQAPSNKPVKTASDTGSLAYANPQMALVGEAQQAARNWEDYQKFITEIENYDHSKAATNRLTSLSENMAVSIPAVLLDQPVASRLLVLKTRVGIYGSAIRNNSLSKKERINKYNQVILALDQLHVQLNSKLNYDKNIEELLELLGGEAATAVDSLAIEN